MEQIRGYLVICDTDISLTNHGNNLKVFVENDRFVVPVDIAGISIYVLCGTI